jgi:hypothetical protein
VLSAYACNKKLDNSLRDLLVKIVIFDLLRSDLNARYDILALSIAILIMCECVFSACW